MIVKRPTTCMRFPAFSRCTQTQAYGFFLKERLITFSMVTTPMTLIATMALITSVSKKTEVMYSFRNE